MGVCSSGTKKSNIHAVTIDESPGITVDLEPSRERKRSSLGGGLLEEEQTEMPLRLEIIRPRCPNWYIGLTEQEKEKIKIIIGEIRESSEALETKLMDECDATRKDTKHLLSWWFGSSPLGEEEEDLADLIFAKLPIEKKSIIDDDSNTICKVTKASNFFQNKISSDDLEKLWLQQLDGYFNLESFINLLETYIKMCSSYAKHEMQRQQARLRELRKELESEKKLANAFLQNKADTARVPEISGQPYTAKLDKSSDNLLEAESPGINRYVTPARSDHDQNSSHNDKMKKLFKDESSSMLQPEFVLTPEIEPEYTEDIFLDLDEDNLRERGLRNDSLLKEHPEFGDDSLRHKCGQTLVLCNHILAQIHGDSEGLFGEEIKRQFTKEEFFQFLPNFLENYAERLGIFQVQKSTPMPDGSHSFFVPVKPLKMGDVPVEVGILSMTCFDVELPWDPLNFDVANGTVIRQLVEHLFEKFPGLDKYKDKFDITIVIPERGPSGIQHVAWNSTQKINKRDAITITF